MSKRSELPHSRHHIMIYDEDWQWLEDTFGVHSASRYGTGKAIKEMVHKAVARLRARSQSLLDEEQASQELEV